MSNHTRTFDTTTPRDSESVSAGASKLRELEVDTDERLQEDHEWNNSVIDGAADQDGTHKKITLNNSISAPSLLSDCIILYASDVLSCAELSLIDESGNTGQLTNAGALKTFLSYSAGSTGTVYIPYPTGYTKDITIIFSVMHYWSLSTFGEYYVWRPVSKIAASGGLYYPILTSSGIQLSSIATYRMLLGRV